MAAIKSVLAIAVAAACVAGGPADATLVHRCRSADGAVVYRDAPCAIGETTLDRREFATPMPTSNPATPDSRNAAARLTPRQAQARAGPATRAGRPDRIVAHECRFGEQRWVQAEACPRSLALADERGGRLAKRAVDETRLTRTQVCGALRDVSSADAPGEGSARRGYGMNRLRQLHGC